MGGLTGSSLCMYSMSLTSSAFDMLRACKGPLKQDVTVGVFGLGGLRV
jgi:hypothetical protein